MVAGFFAMAIIASVASLTFWALKKRWPDLSWETSVLIAIGMLLGLGVLVGFLRTVVDP
jgi:hypothetical protein